MDIDFLQQFVTCANLSFKLNLISRPRSTPTTTFSLNLLKNLVLWLKLPALILSSSAILDALNYFFSNDDDLFFFFLEKCFQDECLVLQMSSMMWPMKSFVLTNEPITDKMVKIVAEIPPNFEKTLKIFYKFLL